MRAGTVNGRVILRHMEINGPRPECGGERLQGLVQSLRIRPVPIRGEHCVFRRVVAKDVKQRMGHVRLEAERLRPADTLEQIHHVFPAVHAAPADLAFGRKALPEALGHVASLGKSASDLRLVAFRILRPVRHAARGINPHHPVRPGAELPQPLANAAGLANLPDKLPAIFFAPHRRTAARRRPYRCNNRSDHKAPGQNLVGQSLDTVVIRINADVGVEEEKIHAVELDPVHLGLGREVEHGIEVNTGFGAGAAFADEAGPHGVVQFWIVVAAVFCAHKSVLSEIVI